MNLETQAQSVEIQARVAPGYSAMGLAAPPPCYGEDRDVYWRRALGPLVEHSQYKGANLFKIPNSVLPAIEEAAVVGTIAKMRAPVGPLREVRERDATGRTITRFFGSPAETWAPFQAPVRNLIGIRGAR